MEEEDTEEDNKEVLAIIEHASGKGRGDKDECNNKNVFKMIKAFKE